MKHATNYLEKLATICRIGDNDMGTITVGIKSEHLFSDIEYDLQNYLGKFINPKLNNQEKHEQKLVKNHSYMIKDGYGKHTFGYTKNGKFIFLASKPGYFFHELYDFKLTIHLSQWKNQEQLIDTLCDIFGARNAQAIFNEGDMLRLDAWLDTNLKYDFLKKSIYRKGVSVSDQRKGDRKTYYLGSKKPTPALFYEKPGIPKELLDIQNRSDK